jgi:hypothetical protein
MEEGSEIRRKSDEGSGYERNYAPLNFGVFSIT